MSRPILPPTILVILGATGDLTHRKIMPALASLFIKGALPERFRVVGFSRRKLSDEGFREQVSADVAERKSGMQGNFLKFLSYQKGDFSEENDYFELAKHLERIDAEWGMCSNKLFYLAVPPVFYETIAKHLASSGLTVPCGGDGGWTRVIVEKPFGNDAQTAARLDALLGKLFKEEQIYRIDHYLGKEMMQNILAFRFANNLFEQNWNNRHIENIRIRFLERLGLEGRGDFYDDTGALRDVGQNHLLQMLALTTMENPVDFKAEAVRKNRAALLTKLRTLSTQDIRAKTARGQYIGYRQEKGVATNSETETYFKIEASLDLPRWEGVPIILESGKFMPKVRKEIEVTFRHPSPCLCPPETHYKNSLVFQMEPEESITVRFWAKEPGLKTMKMEEKDFKFRLEAGSVLHGSRGYEKLLLDCISGDQMLFVSSEEVAAGWKFVDGIAEGWKQGLTPLDRYKPAENTAGSLPERTIGMIGLGKMGANLSRQLMEKNWSVVGWDRTPEATRQLETEGLIGAYGMEEFLSKLKGPKTSPKLIWLMVPAGKPVDELLFGKDGLASRLKKGDIVIDGGNSFYKDTVRRGKLLKKRGIYFLDAGTSGGPGGARNGATVMVGGDRKVYERLIPLFRDISVPEGYSHMGDTGAGHFVKMVHNGIEYGMMQSLAEGFAVMKKSKFKLDLGEIARLYNHGSVIESRLVGWLRNAFEAWGDGLKPVSGTVDSTGEGEWTVKTAKELGVPAPAIEDAFKFRVRSKNNPSYTGQILSALRNQFGGHAFSHDKDKKRGPIRGKSRKK